MIFRHIPIAFTFLCCTMGSALIASFSHESLAHKVTIITTTSPIKSNPSTRILEATQKGLYDIPSLRDCVNIIVFDGINENDYGDRLSDVRQRYNEYKAQVIELKKTNIYFKNTVLLFLDKFHHQGRAVRAAMKLVNTPFVYVHQHDVAIVHQFDVVNLIRTLEENSYVKLIRIANGENCPNYFDGPVDTYVGGNGIHYIPMIRTFRFADSEHFTTVKYYEDIVFPRDHGPNFAESWMMYPDFEKSQQEMVAHHDRYGTYVYGGIGHPSCLCHLDGRKSDS